MQVELSHLDTKLQNQINALCAKYKDAFATEKYEIGLSWDLVLTLTQKRVNILMKRREFLNLMWSKKLHL